MEFKNGQIIPLEGGKKATIVKKLGEGGQGIVYAVKIDGSDYALKWYTFRFQNKKGFRKNLQENIKNGGSKKALIFTESKKNKDFIFNE